MKRETMVLLAMLVEAILISVDPPVAWAIITSFAGIVIYDLVRDESET